MWDRCEIVALNICIYAHSTNLKFVGIALFLCKLVNYSARSLASAEYGINFTTHFGGFHAFSYNSAESELIRMKSGSLWVRCWGLALADIGHDQLESQAKFFCRVRNDRFHRFLVGQISRNWNTTRRSVLWWKLSEQNFGNFITRVIFPKKTQKFL